MTASAGVFLVKIQLLATLYAPWYCIYMNDLNSMVNMYVNYSIHVAFWDLYIIIHFRSDSRDKDGCTPNV